MHGVEWLFVSGTASVGSRRETRHPGDFDAQARQTYRNMEGILKSQNFSVQDVVKWTIYLKRMDDYKEFNRIRDAFMKKHALYRNPPASTCVEARLCRDDLLIEMDAVAVRERGGKAGSHGFHVA